MLQAMFIPSSIDALAQHVLILRNHGYSTLIREQGFELRCLSCGLMLAFEDPHPPTAHAFSERGHGPIL